ncbi:MAG: tyrosine--tRNA ligase [Oligoflexia bacterium]|nr:tyrosine--tRNA ligase [Oligoflexia bacterium]
MTLYDDLQARGLIKQVTDTAITATMKDRKLTVYCGFDPTADSLHVGHMLPLLTLRRFQLAGHRVIAVVGGATGMIGDPSGKSQERSLLSDEQIAHNVEGIRKVISRFLDFKGANPALLVSNGDWFKGLSFIEFLRDVGKHFTVNHMVAKESVRARLEDREHGISYTEFSYMLLQAYDFYVLNEKENCDLQIGGSDQWGNITAGIELIRRMRAARGDSVRECYGLTQPLVTKSDGTKFGKTEGGAVWLDAVKTSPYELYQFFIQTADSDVMTYLRFFTFLSHEELGRLEQTIQSAPEKREAQTALAREMTRLIHGDAELARAEGATQALFGAGIKDLDEKTLLSVMKGAPATTKEKAAIGNGIALVDLLVETGLCSSKGAARKDITSGGIYVNNERTNDPAALIGPQHFLAGAHVVLRKGKKNYHLVAFC